MAAADTSSGTVLASRSFKYNDHTMTYSFSKAALSFTVPKDGTNIELSFVPSRKKLTYGALADNIALAPVEVKRVWSD